jgi:hypothetical protein
VSKNDTKTTVLLNFVRFYCVNHEQTITFVLSQFRGSLKKDHPMNSAANTPVAASINPGSASASVAQFHRGVSGSGDENGRVQKIPFMLKDSGAWKVQVWISFAIALFLCAVGLAYLPGQDLDRAFMVMGYFFCLSTAFVLSKFVRDNQTKKSDTPLYGYVVYVAFAAALALTAWGLFRMTIAESYKAYLLVSWLYLITTTFTLAKTLRDAHEVALIDARESAKAELRAEAALRA